MLPPDYSGWLNSRWCQTPNQQLLTSLRESILDKPPYISGTLQLPSSFFSLFYKVAKDGHDARHIDLTNTSPDELDQLSQACEAIDAAEHNAGKMDTKCFSSELDPFRTDLTKIIQDYLLEGQESTKNIKFEPCELNIYSKGSFSKPHVETPQNEKMFGSLAIVFPTYHEGGALFLRRQNHEWIFDPGQVLAGRGLDSPSIAYVAFLSGVEQEVAPVTSGHRVTLTYNLYFDGSGAPVSESDAALEHYIHPKPPNQDEFDEAFKTLLENPDFMADGGILGFGLRHGYIIEHRGLAHLYDVLKGSDAVVYRSMRALGFEPVLHMYYDADYYHGSSEGVIVDVVVCFEQVFEEYTAGEIARAEGGIPVHQDDGRRYRSESDGCPDPEPMEWVTPRTTYSEQEGIFVCRHTTRMVSGSGVACIIVRIGKAGDRLAYPTVAQVKKAYKQSGFGPRDD